MAPETGRRIDLAVDLMLRNVIPPVGQRPFRRILIFVAWQQFFFVRMAVRTERFFMAHIADILLLSSHEFVSRNKIRGMV
jgi:hypothetical protein